MSDKHLNAQLFELNNGTIRVLLTNYGATIISLFVPDKQGKLDDIVLGFDSVEEYTKGNAPYFGCIVGRVPTESRRGSSPSMGLITLSCKQGPNSLHGGNRGFDKVVWDVVEQKVGKHHLLHSRYPGDVTVPLLYTNFLQINEVGYGSSD
ncbi:hypothetical protein GH714_032927 [Hevea brasiliensis]|uniref:Aldose 1-epimerase n=1 Tax=Hevea brasiliensis TaxID=3981 RepID=A0A6A6L458_HEVBR|nr:hypothetical protein GH714_032927 [Hevea brasiliensis]